MAYLRSVASAASCSGRSIAQFNYVHPMVIPARLRCIVRRNCAVVLASYNFTDAAEERVPGQRRNRGILKKDAREVLNVVRGLTSMTVKQLTAVSHLLPPGTVPAVGIASKLPRNNQGRKRQEALVAKMLRGQLTEQQLDKLGEAVSIATEHNGIFDDGDVAALVAGWREGLLLEDEAVVADVYGYPTAWAPDHQQLRTLVRQCQQAIEEETQEELQQQARAAASGHSAAATTSGNSNSSGSSGDDDDDNDNEEDDMAAVRAEAALRSGAAGPGRRAPKAPEPRSRAMVRTLGKMLRPLATRVVQEGVQEE